MKSPVLPQTHMYTLLIGAAFLLMSFIPFSAHAASSKPSCALTVTTESGSTKITDEGDIIVREGTNVTVAWEGKNATSARYNGAKVANSGSSKHSPVRTTTYVFQASNGSRKATCEVTAHIVDGTIVAVSSGSKPTISGKVTGVTKVNVALYKKGSKSVFFEKKNISIKKGAWEAKVSKSLPEGVYEVRLTGDRKYDSNGIASALLTVGTKNTLAVNGTLNGTLSVSSIPLLGGGTTRAGATVPISYLQLTNTGTAAVRVTGFNVKQNGSASASGITSLSTVDDKGLSRGASAVNPFKDSEATAPTDATIAPGGIKLFTIKATLGSNVSTGKSLMIDVTGIETAGTVRGTFPIRGTTWMIGN